MRSSRHEIDQRRSHIIELVAGGVDQARDLAGVLGVSVATVRRDLAALDEAGSLVRTYGGAAQGGRFVELHVRERMTREREAKVGIARAALQFVPEHGTIFIDAGSTCLALVSLLSPNQDLKIVTRGLDVALSLVDSGIDVTVTGGKVTRLSHGARGPHALSVLNQFRFDVAFLGVDAVDPRFGIGEPTVEEIATKEVASTRARTTVVLADYTKLTDSHVPCWTKPESWTLVTDARAGRRVEEFTREGCRVVIADAVTGMSAPS